MTERMIITDDDSWTELRDGEAATVLGTLRSVSFDNCSLTVSFADWSELLIECPGGGCAAMFTFDGKPFTGRRDDTPLFKPLIPNNTLVRVAVERTEDGLQGVAIWRSGCAPIPLTRVIAEAG